MLEVLLRWGGCFDPYQPPQSETQASAQSRNDGGGSRVGTLAAALLGAGVGTQLIEVAVWLTVSDPDMFDDVTSTVRTVATVLRLSGIVAFLIWSHRIISNVIGFGVRGLRYTPGAAVGYWFFPGINLVHGYRVVAEAWRASDPEDAGDDSHRWISRRADNLILHWWLAYMASRIVALVGRYDARPALWITGVVVEVVAVVLMAIVIRRLDARQRAYARELLVRSRPSAA